MEEEQQQQQVACLEKDDVFMTHVISYIEEMGTNVRRLPSAIAESVMYVESRVPEINRIIHDVWAKVPSDVNCDKILRFIAAVSEYARKQFLVLVENVSELSNVVALEYETPWYPMMLPYVLISQLLTIADDSRAYISHKYTIQTYFADKKDLSVTAVALPAVMNNGFCISTRPVQEYSVCMVFSAMCLISANMRNIDLETENSREQWKAYVKALVRRSFSLIAAPGDIKTHDLAEFRTKLVEYEGLYVANNDIIRRMASALTRFMALIYFFEDYPAMLQPAEPFDDENNSSLNKIYDDICEQSRILYSRTNERMFLTKHIHAHIVKIGDRDAFTEMRNTQDPKPYSVVSMCVEPNIQMANIRLCNSMKIMEKITEIGLTVMDPIYFKIVTTSEQVLVNMLMLHGMEAIMDVLDEKVSFVDEFFVREPLFFTHKNTMVSVSYPVIFLLQDMFHVICNGNRYKCDNLTHAILVWARLFEREFKCIYKSKSILPAIQKLLVLKNTSVNDNEWGSELIGM